MEPLPSPTSDDEFYSAESAISSDEPIVDPGSRTTTVLRASTNIAAPARTRSTSTPFPETALGAQNSEIRASESDDEFIVKNLDTGESFSSKLIDQKIPKTNLDPVSAAMLNRTSMELIRKSSSDLRDNPNANLTSEPHLQHTRASSLSDLKKTKKSKFLKDDHPSISKLSNLLKAKSFLKNIKTDKKETSKHFNIQIAKQKLIAHQGPLWCLEFNFDGILMATGGSDKMIRIWKVDEGFNLFL